MPAWDGAERVSHSTVVLHPTQMSVGIPADGSRSSRMFGKWTAGRDVLENVRGTWRSGQAAFTRAPAWLVRGHALSFDRRSTGLAPTGLAPTRLAPTALAPTGLARPVPHGPQAVSFDRRSTPSLRSRRSRRYRQIAISVPASTVRSLGSPNASIGLAALRAIAMNSFLRHSARPREDSVGTSLAREAKYDACSRSRLRSSSPHLRASASRSGRFDLSR